MRNWNGHLGFSFISCLNIHILPMRNWNLEADYQATMRKEGFTSYLWGIETISFCVKYWNFWEFTSYLWGIETSLSRLNLILSFKFTSYLWGIETCRSQHRGIQSWHSHPTYEELKLKHRGYTVSPHLGFTSYLWGIETLVGLLLKEGTVWFTSYLWGIETL